MIVYLSVCPYVCSLVALCKYYWFDLPDKHESITFGPIEFPLNFESGPDHRLGKRKIKDPQFPFNYHNIFFNKKNDTFFWKRYALLEECSCLILLSL